MPEKDLNALFLDTLKDIYYAEKQIYKALPKMAKAAQSDQLQRAFEKHHDENAQTETNQHGKTDDEDVLHTRSLRSFTAVRPAKRTTA